VAVRRAVAFAAAFACAGLVAPSAAMPAVPVLQPPTGLVVCNATPSAVTASVTFGTNPGYRYVVAPQACLNVSLPPDLKSPVIVTGIDAAGHIYRPKTLQPSGGVQSVRFAGACANSQTDLCVLAVGRRPAIAPTRTP
jgi:hypothetical protein